MVDGQLYPEEVCSVCKISVGVDGMEYVSCTT